MALTDPIFNPLLRYLHILSGIVWIGHLYFFNLVNLPLLKFRLKQPFDVDVAEKATGNIIAKALFWFRWGAMLTLIFGLLLLELRRQQFGSLQAYFLQNGASGYLIALGVALAVIMWFNVWFVIWPCQKTILANNKKIAGGAADDEKKRLQEQNAPLVKRAVMASRFNTWASVPMLFGMVFGAHGGFATTADGAVDWASGLWGFVGLGLLLAIMIAYSNKK